ncbi:MAG: ATP-binding protein [Oscillospiraceae bacterium]|nr:ATP-binding protein [Oscillospiraceae bacterium]
MSDINENMALPGFISSAVEHDTGTMMSQLILDSMPLAVVVLDKQNNVVDCNGAALRLFEAPTKMHLLEDFFMYSSSIQPNGVFAGAYARELVSKAVEAGEYIGDWEHKNRSGDAIPCEITLKRIDYDDTYIIIVYIRDLRAEISAQAEAKEVTERNKLMIDATPICFVFFDDNFNIVDCNPAALTLFRVATAKEFAAGFYSFSPELQADGSLSSDSYRTKMQTAFNDGRLTFEWDHLTADGAELPVDVTFIRVEYGGSYRLAGYFRDLREHRAVLAEMQRAEQQLIIAKELAEESLKIKSEFLANMSHEIRTPMNGIMGITNLAIKNETSPSQRAYLLRIEQSAKLLLRIINDILDFSKIEAGKLEIEQSEFRVESVINEIRNLTAESVSQKGLEFNARISDDISFNLLGDSLRLQQVLLNITGNAVKFTNEGHIDINVNVAERNGDSALILFSVEDTGIGMTETQAAKVFDAFGQADTSTTRKYGGTGLGLAICKALVELMEGEVWLESAPEVGTTFYFTVRVGILPERDLSGSDGLDDGDFVVPAECFGARILLAEDNEINQLIADEMLSSYGFVVEVAVNGIEAVEKVRDNEYDIILMDIQMPEMDGLVATSIIRSDESLARLPIVAMTANAMQGDRERSLEAGMDDHVTKPLMPRLLLETICRWVGEYRAGKRA